ncbi:MAG: ABC transporter ATP-binding protein [Deltaproteobacteria bacterium]|nr:ABC transporter ATP-binding protein [Deltaproteobacteria bacterium]
MNNDVLISVDNVSKKFCRNLKHSLYYGIKDISKDLFLKRRKTPEKISLRKSEFWALKGISFELRRGECLGLIGHNGAGKSTLLKLLNGLIKPDEGAIRMKGRVGALIELGAGFNPILTGRENILINGSILGFTKKEINRQFESIVEFSGIGEFLDMPLRNYSSGMKVRLGFAVAAQMKPDVLLIDEVLAVGDIGFRVKCINKIAEILKNAAVIYVSHQISQVARICTDIAVMDKGKSTYQGKNVSKGIEHYYEQFSNFHSQIYGNGKASIHEIKLYTRRHKKIDSNIIKVDYLDDLLIEVYFSLNKSVTAAIMNIAIFSQDLRAIAQCYSNNCEFDIKNDAPLIKVKVKLPKIQLNTGIYSASISLVDENRRELLVRHEAVKSFQIVGKFTGNSPVQLQGEWKFI